MAKIALGSSKEAADPVFPRSVFTEFLLTFVFVFTGVAEAMSAGNRIFLASRRI